LTCCIHAFCNGNAHVNENVLHSRCLPRWGHVALDLDASVPFHPSSEPVCVDFVV
jgi:hypothetical protein